jgi:hypothetical protein
MLIRKNVQRDCVPAVEDLAGVLARVVVSDIQEL